MGTFVRQYNTFDVNVMVGVGDGLVAPVVRDVGGRGLKGISSEVKALASKAQSGELEAHQVRSIACTCFFTIAPLSVLSQLGLKAMHTRYLYTSMILHAAALPVLPWLGPKRTRSRV